MRIQASSDVSVCTRSIAHLSDINEKENKPKIIVKDEKYCCKLNECNSRSKFMRWGERQAKFITGDFHLPEQELNICREVSALNICWLPMFIGAAHEHPPPQTI